MRHKHAFELIAHAELFFGGAKRDRTADLLVANEALSQLSYSPTIGQNTLPILAVTIN